MRRNKFDITKLYVSHSKLWLWLFFTGSSFGIGYSITKNILSSRILTDQSIPQNLNKLFGNDKSTDLEETTSKLNDEKKNLESKNQPKLDKQLKKIIHVPINENSFRKITIKYSERQSIEKQEVFKNSLDFFNKESLESLKKTLYNTNKTKSSKVEAD